MLYWCPFLGLFLCLLKISIQPISLVIWWWQCLSFSYVYLPLFHFVVNLRMDYCNTILASAPWTIADKLQWWLNTVAHVITSTRKFDRGLGQILHDQLHWPVCNQVLFKLAVTVHQCLNSHVPSYLSDHCIPVSSADTWQHLHSANHQLLAVLHFWLNSYGHRAFLIAGSMAWNSSRSYLDPVNSTDCLGIYLKCICLRDIITSSTLVVLNDCVLYKCTQLTADADKS